MPSDANAILEELLSKYDNRMLLTKTETAEAFKLTPSQLQKMVDNGLIKLELPKKGRGQKTYVSIRKVASALAEL